MATGKKLYRSKKNKVIGGVCGGLAEYFGIDAVIVRVIAVVLLFGYGTGFLIYLAMWILVPENPSGAAKKAS